MRRGQASVLAMLLMSVSCVAWSAQCLYVSSYHKGYEWDDGILESLRNTLAGKCALDIFYLDSKRNPGKDWITWKSRQALARIDANKPDVIIAADDNVSRYLVMPHLKDNDIPVVFCGVNWSIEEYGYPYKNATGIVEVAPARALIRQLKNIRPRIKKGVFLSSDVLTEHKDYRFYKKIFSDYKVSLDAMFVKNFKEWTKRYRQAQRYDFVFVGNNAGINDWYAKEARRVIAESGRKISVSSYQWMLPYVAMAFTKLPEEQGQWAGQVAISILAGQDPALIPVVYNRQWDMWLNLNMIKQLKLKIPYSLYKRAKHF